MRLSSALLASALALAPCGGPSAQSLAKQTCHTVDVLTGVVPSPDKVPSLKDLVEQANRAAKDGVRYDPLAAAVKAWAATTQQLLGLTKHGFKNLTPSQDAELDRLNEAADGQYKTLAEECRKARVVGL